MRTPGWIGELFIRFCTLDAGREAMLSKVTLSRNHEPVPIPEPECISAHFAEFDNLFDKSGRITRPVAGNLHLLALLD